jgi:diaminopimelate decarboxylase
VDYFTEQAGRLFAEQVAVTELAARFGTPLYVYSRATLERHWHAFDRALGQHPHQICFAVKANANIAVLNVLARLGSGFDIVSCGELERVLVAGGKPESIVFSGVGKLAYEIERALEVGIGCFNIESAAELERVAHIAGRLGKVARISIRVNPDIDARTHPYISTGLKENKFGVNADESIALYQVAAKLPQIEVLGIACHIGSQLTELQPFLDALDKIQQLRLELRKHGIVLRRLDLGGGLGVRYQTENPPSPEEYGAALLARLQGDPIPLVLEPGRAIVANAGILVTRVEYLKHAAHKNFAIVDAGMNDLLRPALYQAEQEIVPVIRRPETAVQCYDVVGPVCETGDFLGKERELAVLPGDLLAIRSAGAYGFCMSSNYNSRGRAAEVMVDGNQSYLIRRRETLHELFEHEELLPS